MSKKIEQAKSDLAVENEAAGAETVTIDFDGHEFTLPADPLDWPTRVMRSFEEGKAIASIRGLIGDRKFDRIGIDDWPVRKTTALFEKFAEATGLNDAGE